MPQPRPNCVIRIPVRDSFSTSGPKLMGRQSANEGFLKAWFRHSGQSQFWCLARSRSEAQVFARLGQQELQAHQPQPSFRWMSQAHIHRAGQLGSLYAPGPQVAELAWMRRRDPQAHSTDFSIVGMTHTSCELPVQDALADMLTAPVYPWDAQICPSTSVKTMVQRLLEDEAAWLREHLGASRVQGPQLPVLPLGVDCQALDLPAERKAQLRTDWRARWALAPEDVCVLYLGRLDLSTKANLYPMLDALELAAIDLQQAPRLVLVLAGWFASEEDERIVRSAAAQACAHVRVVFEDGRTPEVRQGVWHAADIFTSLVDNIQETFGLTPIEAMAAGLPVVVSDYDGYRESVREGIDGLRIRTWQPPAGAATDLIDAHADLSLGYRAYVQRASAWVGLDVAQAAQAHVQLARDAALRQRLGQSGRKRAREHYDWAVLLPRYQALFEELALLRTASAPTNWPGLFGDGPPAWGLRHPRRSDPFHSFAHYPSESLTGRLLVYPGPLLPDHASAREHALAQQLERPVYAGVRHELDTPELRRWLERVAQSPQPVDWSPTGGDGSKDRLHPRHLGWLAKTGLVRLEPAHTP